MPKTNAEHQRDFRNRQRLRRERAEELANLIDTSVRDIEIVQTGADSEGRPVAKIEASFDPEGLEQIKGLCEALGVDFARGMAEVLGLLLREHQASLEQGASGKGGSG